MYYGQKYYPIGRCSIEVVARNIGRHAKLPLFDTEAVAIFSWLYSIEKFLLHVPQFTARGLEFSESEVFSETQVSLTVVDAKNYNIAAVLSQVAHAPAVRLN